MNLMTAIPAAPTAPTATVLPIHTALGESPVWDAARQALWLVDIEARRLLCMDWPGLRVQHWDLPETVASIGLCRDGRLLLALKSSVHLFDPATARLTLFAAVEIDRPGNRLNDGKVGPDGSFWVGSMDDATKSQTTGALYQVFADGRVVRRIDGLVTSNGLAWSADGLRLFHSDSRGRFIKSYRYNGGALTDGQLIASPTDAQGRPDGAATDVDGGYWSAGVSAACLNRYTDGGRVIERVALPVAHPTMPCFGGPAMTTLFVTSLVTTDAVASGQLLSFDAGVAGVPVPHFAV